MATRDIKLIERLREARHYEEALGECDKLLDKEPSAVLDVLRIRARIYAGLDDYGRAVIDCRAILDSGNGELRDYYIAGNYALHAERFEDAAHYFRELLRRGDKENETWFKSAAYFFLAYALMELGNYAGAIQNLDNAVAVEADVSMPLPSTCGMCSNQQLREEINRRWGRKRPK
jgi:tetratricopeptide (TPR) repeat protein